MPRELTNGSSYRGAQMGRRVSITEPNHPVKMHLVEMRMSACGAYDNKGAYWGCGDYRIGYMFHAWGDGEHNEQEIFFRATDRFHARLEVRKQFPNVKFYR
jgi:hypothetical protein